MGAKFLRGLAYAALASLITVASCDAVIERDDMRGLSILAPERVVE